MRRIAGMKPWLKRDELLTTIRRSGQAQRDASGVDHMFPRFAELLRLRAHLDDPRSPLRRRSTSRRSASVGHQDESDKQATESN